MARLVIQSADSENAVISLKLGVNTIGRGPDNDFQIQHPTLSSRHCELLWLNETLRVKDCRSTNGVFVNGTPVTEAALEAGQFLRLGNVELFVESTTAEISVPKLPSRMPAPPIPFDDGSLPCKNHPDAIARFRCGHCGTFFCEVCIHELKLRGSANKLQLCPECSGHVQTTGEKSADQKNSILAFLNKTLRLPFKQRKKRSRTTSRARRRR